MSFIGSTFLDVGDITGSGFVNTSIGVPLGTTVGDTMILVGSAYGTSLTPTNPRFISTDGTSDPIPGWSANVFGSATPLSPAADHAGLGVTTKVYAGESSPIPIRVTMNFAGNLYGTVVVLLVYRGVSLTGTASAGSGGPGTSSDTTGSVTVGSEAHALGASSQTLVSLWSIVTGDAGLGQAQDFTPPPGSADRGQFRSASTTARASLSITDEVWASATDRPSRTGSWSYELASRWSAGVLRLIPSGADVIVTPVESWETLSATAADLDATLWPTRQPVSVGPDNESGRETLDGPAAGFPTSRHQHEGSDVSSDVSRFLRRFLLMGERRD